MLIRCPQCGTGFNLPAEKIPERGAKVKCSACTHTFRVRVEGGEAVYFQKPGEATTGQTMIGAPDDIFGDFDAPESADATSMRLPPRSKSSKAGYDPFPLAKMDSSDSQELMARRDSTQLFGSGSDADDSIPPQIEESIGGRTLLGTPMSPGVSRRATPPPLPVDRGNLTNPFGSGIDLFDDADNSAEIVPEVDDFDPFGAAFDAPISDDVGLLMPSTPSSDDLEPPVSVGLDPPSDVGISEAEFLRGGGNSAFGDASSLVDSSFRDEVPSFDPDSGVVAAKRATTSSDQRGRATRLELDRPEAQQPQRRPEPKPEPIRRPAPAYVQQIGATSAARRTFDAIFIALVVTIAFVALIASRAGGFIDFSRFGHMLEVAFTEQEFIPREEWKQVVEIPPPDPPPDEPLRVENVRAVEKKIGDDVVLVLAGRVRNYSLLEFDTVNVKAVVSRGDEVLSSRVEATGLQLDRAAFGKAKTLDAVKKSLVKKLPNVGKEGTTYFVVVFDDIASDAITRGDFDYEVSVAD